jgi:hypothetical protein
MICETEQYALAEAYAVGVRHGAKHALSSPPRDPKGAARG